MPADEVDKRVAARVARQKVFLRQVSCAFYIHEQALQLPVGGPDVMSEQLHHCLRMSVRPYILIRVLPTAVGAHAGLAGSFMLMKFKRISPVVHLESENSVLFLEDEKQIKGYEEVLKALDRSALDEEQSRELITTIAT